MVTVTNNGNMFFMVLPRWNSRRMELPLSLSEALGQTPREVYDAGRDTIVLYDQEAQVRALAPDMAKLLALGNGGYIATAKGEEFDCVSRFFCPTFGLGVDEDPVTGSAHCSIAPFWADRLGKTKLRAWQASPEGGELLCEVGQSTVTLGAPAVPCPTGRAVVDV